MGLRYKEGGFKKLDAGGCFPERPHFPMILANGTDAVLVSYAGAPVATDSVLAYLPCACIRSSGWHKTDRKNFDSDTSYGCSLTLAEPATRFFVGSEDMEPSRTTQVFDPLSAVLTTEFEQVSHRDPGRIRAKVTTFLTDTHLLVQRYDILEAPETPLRMEFRLAPAFDAGSCTVDKRLCMEDPEYSAMKDVAGTCFSYKLKGYTGVAAGWFTINGASSEDGLERKNETTIYTPPLKSGDVLIKYTAVLDNEDTSDPQSALIDLVNATTRDYSEIHAAHVETWNQYHAASDIKLPSDELNYEYALSLYVIRSVFDCKTGFLPMGILPYQWQNCMFWDTWFCSMAWQSANRADYSRKISEFWRGKLEEARALAKKIGSGGARYNWTFTRKTATRNPERTIQFHNNGVVLVQCAQLWKAGGDKNFLRDVYEVMEDSLRFLVEHLVKQEGDIVTLEQCAGPDESVTDRKRSDTWTCAVMIKGIEYYLEAVRVLEKKPFMPELEKLREKLTDTLNRNVDGNGVLQSFEGGFRPHWGSLIFSLFPEHPALGPTLDAISVYDNELDCYNSLGIIRRAHRNFTWAEYMVIRMLGEHGDPAGWKRLMKNVKITNSLGGIPERIESNGEPANQWFMTSHASYILAVNKLLMQRRGDALNIFKCLPADWRELSFCNLVSEDGLRVSAELKDGSAEIEIVNEHPDQRRVILSAPGMEKCDFVLSAGETMKF